MRATKEYLTPGKPVLGCSGRHGRPLDIRNFESDQAIPHSWEANGGTPREATGGHGRPLEIRNFEGDQGVPDSWEANAGKPRDAMGDHGKPLEIRNFESGNAGGSLLGDHCWGTLRATMPREATGSHGRPREATGSHWRSIALRARMQWDHCWGITAGRL